MLDKSVPFKGIVMRRAAGGAPITVPELPEGFRYALYRPGDAARWAAIATPIRII